MKRLVANSNVKLLERTRKALNKNLQSLDIQQHKIPFTQIYDILAEENIVIIQDDYSQYTLDDVINDYNHITDTNTYFSIAFINTGTISNGVRYYEPIANSLLYLSWAKNPMGFEVNCYVS